MCFPPDLFVLGFAGGCAERIIAGGGMATSAGGTSVELEDTLVDPPVNSCNDSGNLYFHTSLVVATDCASSRSPRAFGLAFGCLHAWDHQRNMVIGFTLDVLTFLTRYDG